MTKYHFSNVPPLNTTAIGIEFPCDFGRNITFQTIPMAKLIGKNNLKCIKEEQHNIFRRAF
jgi:hypothetical protein